MAHTKQFIDGTIEKGIEVWRLASSQTKQFIERTRKKGSEIWRLVSPQIRQLIERTGIYIFFISLIFFRQIRWVKKHNGYSEIELRLFFGFLIGILLSFVIIKLIKKIAVKANKEPEAILSNLSIALSPGIFFIFASANKVFLIIGIVLCVLTGLYIWVKPFRDFIDSIVYISNFKNILLVKDGKSVISVQGIYEKGNPQAIQSFLIDLVINFYECSEMKIEEVKIDFSDLKEKSENELKPIIESIARYFNLRIVY